MLRTLAVFDHLHARSEWLDSLAWSFGWRVTTVSDLAELRKLKGVVAVLFAPTSIHDSWRSALAAVHEAAPFGRPIVCRTFSNWIPTWELSAAGGYASLGTPFNPSEVKQVLGFV